MSTAAATQVKRATRALRHTCFEPLVRTLALPPSRSFAPRSNTYSVLNALAGHYNSFGATAPIPKKRLDRIVKVRPAARKGSAWGLDALAWAGKAQVDGLAVASEGLTALVGALRLCRSWTTPRSSSPAGAKRCSMTCGSRPRSPWDEEVGHGRLIAAFFGLVR